MKFTFGLALLSLITLASTTYAQETKSVEKPKAGKKALVKADEATAKELETVIKAWSGSPKKSKAKSAGKKGDARIVYSKKKVKRNKKVWGRILAKKGKSTYAAVGIEKKCKSKKIEADKVKEAMLKSLKEGKPYKVNCDSEISIAKLKSKSKKAKKSSE